jgi:hypothetical protein
MIGGLLCTIVVLQFAGVIPWAGDEASYIGGDWTGAVAYALVAGLFFGAAYAWITVKRWAHMVSILAALIGFFIPFMSYMDGTDPRSSAISPLVVSVLMLFLVFRPSTNRAMALALSGQGSSKASKPPPPKPMSAARKRELAAEQKQTRSETPKAAPSVTTTAVATSPATPRVAPAPAPASAPVKSAAAMVMTAAASLKAAAATPASPRRSGASPVRPAAPNKLPASPASAPPPAQRPRGFRADEV